MSAAGGYVNHVEPGKKTKGDPDTAFIDILVG